MTELYYIIVESSDLDREPLLSGYDGAVMENSEGFGVLLSWRGRNLLVVGTQEQIHQWVLEFNFEKTYVVTEYAHHA